MMMLPGDVMVCKSCNEPLHEYEAAEGRCLRCGGDVAIGHQCECCGGYFPEDWMYEENGYWFCDDCWEAQND